MLMIKTRALKDVRVINKNKNKNEYLFSYKYTYTCAHTYKHLYTHIFRLKETLASTKPVKSMKV